MAPNPTPNAGFAGKDSQARYARQMRFEPIGEEGQRRLAAAQVVLVGCGALGSTLADMAVRAGVGRLRIIDRDFVEATNLQRQSLFDEQDVAAGMPKAHAAAEKLRRTNSQVAIEPLVEDLTPRNARRLVEGVDLILDGTDNLETRFLVNDAAVSFGTSWTYGACVGASGMAMAIVPGHTPCLRCLFEGPAPPELNPTCETAGIISPAVHVAAALEMSLALQILTGNEPTPGLWTFDLWAGRISHLGTEAFGDRTDCPCCGRGEFPFLEGTQGSQTAVMCGRNAVQITPAEALQLDLVALAERLVVAGLPRPTVNPFLVRAEAEGLGLTVFPDGRAIISGTNQPERARTVYARYVGN